MDEEHERLLETSRQHLERSEEALRAEIRNLHERVAHLDQTLDRATDGIREEMRRGFAETWAIIRGTSE